MAIGDVMKPTEADPVSEIERVIEVNQIY